jgi:hypothetical protein
MKLIESRGKAKIIMELTTNLIKKEIKEGVLWTQHIAFSRKIKYVKQNVVSYGVQAERIAPLPFFHGCRKRRLKD